MDRFLPYGRQVIEDDDIAAVSAALRGDYLTTGPLVEAFEKAIAARTGADHVTACSNGTTALHLANLALGMGPGDCAIVPAVTFLATANAVRYTGADVIFADVDPDSGLATPETIQASFESAGRPVKAVFPVALGGQAADRRAIREIAFRYDAAVVDDACHAFGSELDEGDETPGRAGDCRYSDMAVFSFHPVKTVATGEGGAVTTNSAVLKARLDQFRNHGMVRDSKRYTASGIGFDRDGTVAPWAYEMSELGFNYRIPDILCALGISQLAKLDRFVTQRRALVGEYDQRLTALGNRVRPVRRMPGNRPCLHLYAVLIDFDGLGITRSEVMRRLAARGIGSQVHYIPVCHQPYYRELYGEANVPGADAYYARTLSLPLYPAMTSDDVARVVEALAQVLGG